MKRIQLLQASDWWTQRKDTEAPGIECQVTSGANFLMAMGLYPSIEPTIPLDVSVGKPRRLPDYINDVAESEEGEQIAIKDGWRGAPREDHLVLAWAINKVAGRNVNSFQAGLDMEQIFHEIAKGKPVILSGIFGQYKSAKDGLMHDRDHVVCLTGLETTQDDVSTADAVDLGQVTAALVADPYGDFHTDYASEQGAECRFSVSELMDILEERRQDSKWAHVAVI